MLNIRYKCLQEVNSRAEWERMFIFLWILLYARLWVPLWTPVTWQQPYSKAHRKGIWSYITV